MRGLQRHLVEVTRPGRPGGFLNGAVASVGYAAFAWGRRTPDGAAGPLDPGLRVRAASISKAVTARAVAELVVAGLPLGTPVVELLPWDDPPLPARRLTVGALCSHTSGLTDARGYLAEPPEPITAFVTRTAPFAATPPGWFRYANLNYVLLGAVIEAVTGQRFDTAVRRLVLDPAGIAGGFNWAGVPPAKRSDRLPLYQRHGDALTVQADADDADWNADLIWRGGRGHSFADYTPVRDISLMSPHAGLRVSVVELALLAQHLGVDTPAARLQRREVWRFDPVRPNGHDGDGLFPAFGLGVTRFGPGTRIARPLVGHAGHALGFTGGAWHDRGTGESFAYFLTGSADLTEGRDDEVFFPPEELTFLAQAD